MFTKTKSIIQKPIFKSLISLSIPIILANLFQVMYQMTDSFWLGRLGSAALASVSICSPVIFLTVALGIGFAIAGSTLVAQYFGAKDHHMVSHSAAQTLLMITFTSLIFSTLGFIFAPKILYFMGANSEIFPSALGFLRVSFLAIIFNFSFFMFQSIMRGIGRPQIPVIIVIGTVLLNFFLDPLFIFGWKSVPAFGVLGAVMATIITQGIAAIIGLSILLGGKYGIHLKIKDFIPDFKFIKKSFLIGLPASIEQSSRNLAMAFMISLVAGFGTTAVASYGAGSNIIQVAIFIGMGLAVANGTLVGQNIGANQIEEAIKVSKLSAVISFVILSFLGIVVFIFSNNLVSFFIPNDTSVIQSGSIFIKIVALSFGFIGLHMSFSNVFSAAGLTRIPMFLTVSSQWLFQIPLSFILSKYTALGLYGVWISIPFTNVFVSSIAFILYSRGSWKNSDIIDRNKYQNLASEKVLSK